VLPGDVTSLRPFIPYFLQCWLARSGSLPLTLRIADNTPCLSRFCAHRYNPSRITATNSQLLDIFSESKRWQTVVMPPKCNWGINFNTLQLRALFSRSQPILCTKYLFPIHQHSLFSSLPNQRDYPNIFSCGHDAIFVNNILCSRYYKRCFSVERLQSTAHVGSSAPRY